MDIDTKKAHPPIGEPPQIVRTVQKGSLYRKIFSFMLEWRHSDFVLDTLMVEKTNIPVNQIVGFLECLRLVPVDTFSFQDVEEISCHSIAIRITLT